MTYMTTPYSKTPAPNQQNQGITGQTGLVGDFTNHFSKRTCATQLYKPGVDEQEIMSRTGHRSETAVRKYMRSKSALMEIVSKVLDSPKMMKFETHSLQ